MEQPAIRLDHLTKWYGKQRGIVGIDLAVAPGEVFGFIGPNGAGKSTTIRLLLGLIRPTSGRSLLFGQEVSIRDAKAKADVGYLPAEVRYYGDMTVDALLRYSAGFYPKRKLADVHELAERLDLDLGMRIDRLSLGNRKKVGIVQALLHRPRLLVLDEPTSGLDPLIQSRFFTLLSEYGAQGGTVFFSSHVLSEVQRLCHRVAIVKEGRVAAVEEVDALRSGSVKRITVTLHAGESPWVPEGARDIARDGSAVSYLYHGGAPSLLEGLGRQAASTLDATIEQPSLEEVFMHYYGEEGA